MSGSLVVQTGYLGDLVMTLPLARALHERDGGEKVSLLVRHGLGELARAQGYIDEVIELDKRAQGISRVRVDLSTIRALRRRQYSTVYAAHRSFRSRLLVRLSGASRRVGFRGRSAGWAYSHSIPFEETEHAVERFLALGGLKGACPKGSRWLATPEAARRSAREMLERRGVRDRPYSILAPGSVWATKRWTEAGFADVAASLVERGHAPVLVGSPQEREITARIATTRKGAIDLGGQTDLLTLVALIQGATCVVGNDSGVGHLAAAVGTAVVSIFGPTAPRFGFTPWTDRGEIVGVDGLDCRPCSRHGGERCPLVHHHCMKQLDAGSVVEAIQRLISAQDTSEAPPPGSSSIG